MSRGWTWGPGTLKAPLTSPNSFITTEPKTHHQVYEISDSTAHHPEQASPRVQTPNTHSRQLPYRVSTPAMADTQSAATKQKYESLLPPLDPAQQKHAQESRRASTSGIPSSLIPPPSSSSQSRNSVDGRMFQTNKSEKQKQDTRNDRPMRLMQAGEVVGALTGLLWRW
jgi:hypothetical protein